MNTQMPEFLVPRNKEELCELFEDLLFMRTEKFSMDQEKNEDSDFKPNAHDTRILYESGVTGRIFRRWFQTAWGDRNWSTFFIGETPRQELGYCYGDIKNGDALLFVEMRKKDKNKGYRVVPHLSLKKDTSATGGVLTSGLKNIKPQASAPNFDIGFKKFAENLFELEKASLVSPSYKPPKDEEEKWWRLFWSQAGTSLSHNIYLELPQKQLLKTASEIQKCLDSFVRRQKQTEGDFIEVDNLFAYLWEILMNADKRLVSYSEMIDRNDEHMTTRMSDPDYLYSTKVFFYLGHMFDEKILFPIDMYFGGVECVWTDRRSFLETLMNTVALLKKDLAVSADYTNSSAEEKRLGEYMGIENIVFNIERIWFAPPTVFRFLPRVMRYF